MTMIYDPIPFVKLVQKTLVGDYDLITGIWVKIFIINLHNLQMLFMLWIKYKVSECLPLCTNMKVPNGRLSGDGSAQTRRYGQYLEAFNTKFFVPLQILLCSENFVWNIWQNRNSFPLKFILPHQTYKPDYGPGSAEIVSAIRIFCFEGHSASRCTVI